MQRYIGIPFIEKGRDRKGLDCWGLLRLVYKDFLKVDLPSYIDDYTKIENRTKLTYLIKQGIQEDWISVQDPIKFDGALLRILGTETHVGVMINSKDMLHVHIGTETCIENVHSRKWKHQLIGFFRHRSQL